MIYQKFQFIKSNKFFSEISYALLITVLFLITKGYYFNSGDQADHLVPVYEKISLGTFKGDFFMDYQSGAFSIRQLYITGLYFLSFIGPLSFWCFLFNCIAIFSTILAWIKISYLLTQNVIVKYLAPVVVFLVLYNFTVGGNNIMYGQFTCGVVAKGIVPWGILLFLQQKFIKSAVWLGLGTLFHPIVGLQLFLIFSAMIVYDFKLLGWKNIILFMVIYILVSSPILYLNFKVQFFDSYIIDKNNYINIYYHFRNPHHYIPSYFPIIQWVKYILILAAMVAIAIKTNLDIHNKLVQFVAIQSIGLIIYSLLIEGFDIYKFASIQWFKTTIWVVAFASVGICQWFSTFDFVVRCWAKLYSFFENSYLHLAIALVGLLFILNSKYIPITFLSDNFEIGNAPISELNSVHNWIKSNIPAHCIFIAPPSDYGFGCQTQLPSIINAKAIVHEPQYLHLWYQRFTTIYNTRLEDLEGKSFVEKAEENYRKGNFDVSIFKAEYGLVYKPNVRNDSIIYETEHLAVVKF